MLRRRMKVSRPILPILTLKLVAMARSLERSVSNGKIDNIWSNTYYTVKFGENRSGGFWDNFSERFILNKETTGCTYLPVLNSRLTGPKFTKFTYNVARSSKRNIVNQNGDTAIRFGMPGLRINMNSPILPISTLKLVAMATFIERSEKEVKSVIYDQIPTIQWKFGKTSVWDNLSKSLF